MPDVQFQVVVIIHQTRYSLLKATIHGATLSAGMSADNVAPCVAALKSSSSGLFA